MSNGGGGELDLIKWVLGMLVGATVALAGALWRFAHRINERFELHGQGARESLDSARSYSERRRSDLHRRIDEVRDDVGRTRGELGKLKTASDVTHAEHSRRLDLAEAQLRAMAGIPEQLKVIHEKIDKLVAQGGRT